MLPIFRPLKDRAVATVWSGLAASTIGEDLFRVAVVWIVAEQIGNAAGYVNASQYGAMLVVGLLGASVIDRWRADRAMVASKYVSAVLALLPVAGFYVWGVSIPLLVLSVMGIAAMRMVFTPALQSAVPVLVVDRDALQAINGLFDATWRLARLIGPMLAAVLNALLPVIHFLSVTARGLRAVGRRDLGGARPAGRSGDRPHRGRGGWRGAWDALLDGARLMLREPTTGTLLLVNAIANGPWSVALQLCIALMVAGARPASLWLPWPGRARPDRQREWRRRRDRQPGGRQRALPPTAVDDVPGLRRDGRGLRAARGGGLGPSTIR